MINDLGNEHRIVGDEDIQFGLAANVASDGCLRVGGKVWVLFGDGGQGLERLFVCGLNHQGRAIDKWVAAKRLVNYRSVWTPPAIKREMALQLQNGIRGTKAEMTALAASLNGRAA